MTVQDQDLELAALKLKKRGLSLVVVRKGQVIFETKSQGINGFLQAIEKLGEKLFEASVGDKVVGVAAAMLCSYAGVSSVFALTVSEEGRRVLEDNNVAYQFEKKVPNILNRDKKDVCPFEKMAIGSRNPEEAYAKLRSCTTQATRNSVNKP